MFQFQGIWFPDGEKHFPEWMAKNGELVDGKGTYQIKKFRAAMEYVKNFRTAIDVGAHVGLWSMHLAKRFQNVFAYEPVMGFRECFIKNVDPEDWELRALEEGWGRGGSNGNVELIPYALGSREGLVGMVIDPSDSGGTHVSKEPGQIRMRRLDDEFLHTEGAVDFLKIDCEGFEHEVIAGAREVLLSAKPCVIVEQKPHKLGPNFGIKGTPAVDLLKDMGAKVRVEIGGDWILSWD